MRSLTSRQATWLILALGLIWIALFVAGFAYPMAWGLAIALAVAFTFLVTRSD